MQLFTQYGVEKIALLLELGIWIQVKQFSLSRYRAQSSVWQSSGF